MNKKLSHFLPGLALAAVLSFNLTACNQATSPISTINAEISNNNLKSGVVVLKLSDLVAKSGFKTKALFTDSSITQIKIDIDGYGLSTVSKTVKWDRSTGQTVSILVPPGKNRIISVTGLNAIGTPVAKLMGVTDVIQDTTTIVSLNYGSTPAARVLANILGSSRPDILSRVDGEKLKRLMYNITGYRDSDNTYGSNGVDPLLVDVYAISQRIISNNGDIDENNIDDINSPVQQGKLKVYVKDAQGNPITSGISLRINDLTGNNPVSNGNYSTINADQGTWEVSAKAYVNASGTVVSIPLNNDQSKNIILNGGNILYAKKTVTVKGTQEQEVTLTLDEMEVKEIQLYKGEVKLNNPFNAEVFDPIDLDARVIYEDGTYSDDEVIWETPSGNDVFKISPDGILTSYKTGNGNVTIRSILDRDITASYGIIIRDSGVGPIITSFGTPIDGNLTIYGRNFDDLVPFNNIVRINGVKADVIAVTTDSIKVKIPNSGQVGTGYITIENTKGSDTSDNQFVGAPITSISGSVPIAGGDFIMGSPNTNQITNLSTMVSELDREARINYFLSNTTAIDPTITSSSDLASTLTASPSKITAIVNYTTVNETTFKNDISSASASTTIYDILTNSKYHTYDNNSLTSSTMLSGMNSTLLSYVSAQTSINKEVLSLAVTSGNQTSTVYDLLNSLKNYATANGVSYGPSESPMIKVSVSPFTMDTYEVSNKDYKSFVDANGYNKRDYWTSEGWSWKIANNISQPLYWNDPKYNQDDQPVVGVSWFEAYAYAKWAGKRLPTEAEWEMAAKGGVPTQSYPWSNKLYPWGNTDPSSGSLGNGYFGADGSNDGFKYVADVNSFMSGVTTQGIANMSGNVSEWVSDWYQYEYYGRNTELVNPMGPVSGTFKMTRGGSWSNGKNELRNSYRDLFLRPESRNLNLGFRCVR